MSQTANANSGPVISSSQIDYKQSMYSHPSYRFSPQFSNTFGQPIILGASQTLHQRFLIYRNPPFYIQ